MRSRLVISLLFIALAAPFLMSSSRGQVKAETLAPQFQEWLKVVQYHIGDKEREVFMTLTNDRDRDLFIQMFWKQRDPTPATPQNEFRDEIYNRFREVNRRFRFGSAREGWQTDRGQIWMILGEPVMVNRIPGSNDLWPTEIWSYYGDADKGTPPHFCLVFYQFRNLGEYKLYDPFVDGPYRLLVMNRDYDQFDYEALYERLYELAPDLADVSLSIIPGDIPFAYRPSTENVILMAAIFESPKKAINESYATHFQNFRGYVNTEYMTKYMESDGTADVVFDSVTGLPFVDFALAPKSLSLDLYEPTNEYSCSFEINVSLRDGEKIIFQYSKEYPLTIPQATLAETENMGINIQDGFPAIPGRYRLSVLLQNNTGREFTVFERDVEIPSPGDPPVIVGPAVGFRYAEAKADTRLPYQSGGQRLQVDPKNTFGMDDAVACLFHVVGLTDELWKSGSVQIVLRGTEAKVPFEKSFTVRLSDHPFRRLLTITQTLPTEAVPPDYYDLVATLLDGQGKAIAERKAHLILTAQKSIAHPITLSKGTSQASRFVFDYVLASQYDKAGNPEAAESAYERALKANPSFTGRIPEYGGFLVRAKKFERALELAERIKDDTRLAYQYHFIRGQALLGLERYEEATASLQEANKIYNSDTALLHALGMVYWKTGRPEDALKVLEASLKLNPDQPEVRALIAEIQKR